MTLAAPTLYVAVDTALLADTDYMAVAVDRGAYAAGDVPPNQRLDNSAPGVADTRHGYTEIGSSSESPDDLFATEGADGVLTLAVRATSKRWALILARHVHRVLHGAALPPAVMNPDSQALVRGDVHFVEDFPNPDGGHSAVLHYRTSTVSTA